MKLVRLGEYMGTCKECARNNVVTYAISISLMGTIVTLCVDCLRELQNLLAFNSEVNS